jgi:hypothetical protein
LVAVSRRPALARPMVATKGRMKCIFVVN